MASELIPFQKFPSLSGENLHNLLEFSKWEKPSTVTILTWAITRIIFQPYSTTRCTTLLRMFSCMESQCELSLTDGPQTSRLSETLMHWVYLLTTMTIPASFTKTVTFVSSRVPSHSLFVPAVSPSSTTEVSNLSRVEMTPKIARFFGAT